MAAAAIETSRPFEYYTKLEQGPDHPTNIYHPEGHCLKGIGVVVCGINW